MYIEPGAIAMQTPNIRIESSMGSGGVVGALKRRMLSDEALFTTKVTALQSDGWVDIAPSYPGDVEEVAIDGDEFMLTKGSWLASSLDVKVDTKFGGSRTFFGGEGAFLMKCSGRGKVVFAAYGGIDVHELGVGEGLVVDTGHLVGYTGGMRFDVRRAGGIMSSVTSKEGLMMEFQGPGVVVTQSRNPSSFASFISSLVPSTNGR